MFVVSLSRHILCWFVLFVWSRPGTWSRLQRTNYRYHTKKKGGASRRVAFHAPSNTPRRSHSTKDNDWILVGHGLRVQHSHGGGSGGRCVPIFFPAFTCVRCMRLKRDVRFARLLEGKQFYGKEGYFRGLLSYRNNADARRTDASFPELVILPLYVD